MSGKSAGKKQASIHPQTDDVPPYIGAPRYSSTGIASSRPVRWRSKADSNSDAGPDIGERLPEPTDRAPLVAADDDHDRSSGASSVPVVSQLDHRSTCSQRWSRQARLHPPSPLFPSVYRSIRIIGRPPCQTPNHCLFAQNSRLCGNPAGFNAYAQHTPLGYGCACYLALISRARCAEGQGRAV